MEKHSPKVGKVLNKMALVFYNNNFKNKPKPFMMELFARKTKNINEESIIGFFKKFNILLILISTSTIAQGNYDIFDMTDFLGNMEKSWSIGNGVDSTGNFYGPYFEAVVNGDMNMNGNTLEIMNSRVRVLGDTLFSGPVIKRFFGISELIVEGSTLSNDNPTYQDLKYYLRLYPNPAIDYFIVQTNKDSYLTLYDMLGKVIIKTNEKDTYFRLDVSLQAGIYFIQAINDNNQKLVKRLIIK